MTTEEFSNEFDILLNSYTNTQEFGNTPNLLEFNEYEKSIFLTRAQEQLVEDYYKGTNSYSFEQSEEIRRSLEALVVTEKLTKQLLKKSIKDNNTIPISSNSIIYELPQDLWFITYESAIYNTDSVCLNQINPIVVPVTQDDFYNINRNPFRGPSDKRILRLDISKNKIELVSLHPIKEYIVRYIKKPSPIILVDLPNELTINNIHNKTECELNTLVHRTILDKAVQLALISKSSIKNN